MEMRAAAASGTLRRLVDARRSPVSSRDDLVRRAAEGDHASFTALARASADRMYSIAFRVLRDRSMAEDAVQDTLVEVWRNLRALREVDRFDAWSTRILVRNCYREARRSRRSVTLADEPSTRTEDPYRGLDDKDQLERGFRHLTAEQRTVLVLRHYLGMEPVEIGASLNMNPATVRSRLHYAHRALRAAVDADARSRPLEVIE